jgi:hypothetical protein
MSERELPIPSETHHGAKPAVAYTPMPDAFAPEERSAKITALTKTTCAHAARGFPQRRCLGLPDLAGATGDLRQGVRNASNVLFNRIDCALGSHQCHRFSPVYRSDYYGPKIRERISLRGK